MGRDSDKFRGCADATMGGREVKGKRYDERGGDKRRKLGDDNYKGAGSLEQTEGKKGEERKRNRTERRSLI